MRKILFHPALLALLLFGCDKEGDSAIVGASPETQASCVEKNRVVRDIVSIGWDDDWVDTTFMLSDANVWKPEEVVYLSSENRASGFAHGHFRAEGLDRVVVVEDLGPFSMSAPGHRPDAWLWARIDARWQDGTCHQTATIHEWDKWDSPP